MKFQPGTSGNPNGRPRKKLSQMLADVGSVADPDHSQKLAKALWQFAVTGIVQLDHKTLEAETVKEWFDAVKWIYEHIDGKHPVKTDTDIIIHVEYENPRLPE